MPAIIGAGTGGVGIELGDLGDGRALGGIDLDTCRAPDGRFEPWAHTQMARFGTYAEISPSGTGAKLFFLVRSCGPAETPGRHGAGQLGKTVEVRRW